jgi:hypothetical protein
VNEQTGRQLSSVKGKKKLRAKRTPVKGSRGKATAQECISPAQWRSRGASMQNRPSLSAARVVLAYQPKLADPDNNDMTPGIDELMQEISNQCQAVNDGDMKRAEAMLMAQGHALQALFTRLAERANAAQHLSQFQTYMGLALKAQSQCRATMQTLVEVKYPRVQFVKQQNVAVNQQVNNGPTTADVPARETENPPNKLLEQKPHERLDFGTQGTARGTHPQVATMGKVHRATDGRG